MPTHLNRVCSAIDDLPLDFKVLLQSEAGESGLSQGLESLVQEGIMAADRAYTYMIRSTGT
jgi:hypothetical protein